MWTTRFEITYLSTSGSKRCSITITTEGRPKINKSKKYNWTLSRKQPIETQELKRKQTIKRELIWRPVRMKKGFNDRKIQKQR